MQDQIKEYIEDKLIADHQTELQMNDDLLTSGLVDSMGVMKLVTFLEDAFDITIPPEDMIIEHFLNIEAIANFVETKK